MEKVTVTAKPDVKAGPVQWSNASFDFKDVLPVTLGPIPIPKGGCAKVAIDFGFTPPAPPAGTYVVSVIMITSDAYADTANPAKVVQYQVDRADTAASAGQGQPQQGQGQGQQGPAQQQPGQAHQGQHGQGQQQGGYGAEQVVSPGAASPPQTGGKSTPAATSLDCTPAADGRLFDLQYPHLFLGHGAVKLLSPTNADDAWSPKSFTFFNKTDQTAAVTVYIGRTVRATT